MNFSNSGRTRVHLSLGVKATLLAVPTTGEYTGGAKPVLSSSSPVGMGTYADRAEVVMSSLSSWSSFVAKEVKANVDGTRNAYVNGITKGKP
jgi:hypothetical protein